MNQRQFLLEHQEPIKAIKKRAFKKAALVCIGMTSLLIFLFGSVFWILLLFPLIGTLITYFRLKQLYLHQQFPDHFEPPKIPKSRNLGIFSTTHPLNPASIHFWDRWQ